MVQYLVLLKGTAIQRATGRQAHADEHSWNREASARLVWEGGMGNPADIIR